MKSDGSDTGRRGHSTGTLLNAGARQSGPETGRHPLLVLNAVNRLNPGIRGKKYTLKLASLLAGNHTLSQLARAPGLAVIMAATRRLGHLNLLLDILLQSG